LVVLGCSESPTDLERGYVGEYENHHYDNGGKNSWHYVTLSRVDASTLLWSNAAGVSWTITATDDSSLFLIGPDSPYWDTPYDQDMNVVFDSNGAVLYVTGPCGEYYDRQGVRFSGYREAPDICAEGAI